MFTQKYSREEMSAAFDLVSDKTNWKNPIDAVVQADEKMLDVIYHAVIFFAGCAPEFQKLKKGVRVTAEGYYMAVGS